MKKHLILAFTIIYFGFEIDAQVKYGITAGYQFVNRISAPYVTFGSTGIRASYGENGHGGSTYLGLVLSHTIKERSIKYELNGHRSSQNIDYLIPIDDPNSNFSYFSPNSPTSFLTLNFRSLVNILNPKPYTLYIGPTVEWNIKKHSYERAYFADDYPEAGLLDKQIYNSYNPFTLYAEGQIGALLFNRLDISLSIKKSLTSKTGKFTFQGNSYKIDSDEIIAYLRLEYFIKP